MCNNNSMNRKKIETIYGGDTFGKTKRFDVLLQDPTKKWNKTDWVTANILEWVFNVQRYYLRMERESYSDRFDGEASVIDLFSVYLSTFVEERFRQYYVDRKLTIKKAFHKAVQDFIKQDLANPVYPKDKFALVQLEMMTESILDEIDYQVLRQIYASIKEDFILVVDTFSETLLFNAPKTLKGIICKTLDNETISQILSIERQIPIAVINEDIEHNQNVMLIEDAKLIIIDPTENEISKHQSNMEKRRDLCANNTYNKENNVKLYVTSSEKKYLKNLGNINWYEGLCSYDAILPYLERKTTPSREQLYDEYYEVMKYAKGKEVFFDMPFFQGEKTIIDLDFLDINRVNNEEEPYIIGEALKAIAEVSKALEKEVNIVVPMVRSVKDFEYWKFFIELMFSEVDVDNPKIGMNIETKDAYDNFEEFKAHDFAIIQLDNLINDIFGEYNKYETKLQKEDFLEDIADYIRDIHQYYRTYKNKKRHIIAGKCLANPEIFKKVRVMGFREIAVPSGNLETYASILTEAHQSVGKYAGATEKKKKETVIATNEKNKKDDEEPQDI